MSPGSLTPAPTYPPAINETCFPMGERSLPICNEVGAMVTGPLTAYESIYLLAGSALLLWAVGYQVLLQQVKLPQRDVRLMEMGVSEQGEGLPRALVIGRRVNDAIVPVIVALVFLSFGVGLHLMKGPFSAESCQSYSGKITDGCEWGLDQVGHHFIEIIRDYIASTFRGF